MANRLPQKGDDVDVFEIRSSPKPVCGCAIPHDLLKKAANACDLEGDRYVLWQGNNLMIRYGTREVNFNVKNLCTFDKNRFMEDLVKESSANFHFGETLPPQKYGDYDLVIDASGLRAVLGKLPSDSFAICYQAKVEFDQGLPFPDFFIDFPNSKEMYRWMFPLSPRVANVGYGAHDGSIARSTVLNFVDRYHGRILEQNGRLLRLNPPHQSRPFYQGNCVGVGGSIGSISRIGEGNGPSIQSTMLLMENIDSPEKYQQTVLDQLGWLQDDFYAYGAWCNNEKVKMAFHLMKCGKHYDESFGIGIGQLFRSLSSMKKIEPLPP